MKTLITKLKQAQEGSRELDAEIAQAIGWTYRKQIRHPAGTGNIWTKPDNSYHYSAYPPKFTTSLDAARGISNWLLLHASDIGADGLALVKLGDPSTTPTREVTGIHSRLEMAWCIAALKAQGEES